MMNINDIEVGEYYKSVFVKKYLGDWDEFIKIEYLSKDYILCKHTYGGLDPFPIWSTKVHLVTIFHSIRQLTEHENEQIRG